MSLTQEDATLWLASFALTFTVLDIWRLPSLFALEYAKGHSTVTQWFQYLYMPIWGITMACQATSWAFFFQETPNDYYTAFLIVAICDVFLIRAWLWAWAEPIHPILSAILAFLIVGTQGTQLGLAVKYSVSSNWVYWMASVALFWKVALAIVMAWAAWELTPHFYEYQRRTAAKDDALNELLESLLQLQPSERASMAQSMVRGQVNVHIAEHSNPATPFNITARRAGVVHHDH